MIFNNSIGHSKTHNKEPESYKFKTILRDSQLEMDGRQEGIRRFIGFIDKIPGVTVGKK